MATSLPETEGLPPARRDRALIPQPDAIAQCNPEGTARGGYPRRVRVDPRLARRIRSVGYEQPRIASACVAVIRLGVRGGGAPAAIRR